MIKWALYSGLNFWNLNFRISSEYIFGLLKPAFKKCRVEDQTNAHVRNLMILNANKNLFSNILISSDLNQMVERWSLKKILVNELTQLESIFSVITQKYSKACYARNPHIIHWKANKFEFKLIKSTDIGQALEDCGKSFVLVSL